MTHLPVEEVREALSAVALVDALTASLLAEADHLVGELSDRVLDRLGATVDDVDSVVLRVLNELVHVASARPKISRRTAEAAETKAHPKPERLVVIEGTPMTVHSAGVYPHGS